MLKVSGTARGGSWGDGGVAFGSEVLSRFISDCSPACENKEAAAMLAGARRAVNAALVEGTRILATTHTHTHTHGFHSSPPPSLIPSLCLLLSPAPVSLSPVSHAESRRSWLRSLWILHPTAGRHFIALSNTFMALACIQEAVEEHLR